MGTVSRDFRARFANGVKIPTRIAINALPEGIEVFPSQDAVERAAKQSIEIWIVVGRLK